MKFLRWIATASVILGLVPAAAMALTLPPGPVSVKLFDFESVSGPGCVGVLPIPVGCSLSGQLRITQITNAAGTQTFFVSGGAEGITGTISGLTVSKSSASELQFTGGTVALTLNTTTPNADPGTPGFLGPAGSFFTATMVPGALAIPGVTLDASLITLAGVVHAEGSFFLDVVPGSGPFAGAFHTLAVPTLVPGLFADIGGITDILAMNPASNFGFQFRSSDPLTAVVPEPASVLLIGSGLLGLVAVGRLRKRMGPR